MFQPNEYIVYGRSGVCLVERIEQIDGQDYYCLHALHQNCHIKTPVNGKVPMRQVISKEQAEALIDLIPSIRTKTLNYSSTRELGEKYRAFVSSQNCRDLLELTMLIYEKKREAKKTNKRLSSTDEVYWREGEGLLFGELSIALGIPFDQVQSYIRNRIEK